MFNSDLKIIIITWIQKWKLHRKTKIWIWKDQNAQFRCFLIKVN